MPLHGNVSGTWKSLTAYINVGGTWKQATVWKNVSGVWKNLTAGIASLLGATLSGWDLSISPTDSVATLTLSNAGTYTITGAGGGTWQSGGSASDYEARWTTTSGTLSSGTTGTWLGLGTSRSWTIIESTNGYATSVVVGTLEVRMAAAPNTVLSTTTVTLTAQVEV